MQKIIDDLLKRKSLISELILKDLKVRYLRPALGFFWAFLSPLLVTLIFYVVFSVFLKIKTPEAPFLLYLMSAVFSWRFFQDTTMCSVTSLIDNKNLIRESNFPHYFIPLSIVLAGGINFLPSLGILALTAFFILKGFPVLIILLPLALIIHLLIAIGVSCIVSLFYVRWRDTKYILEAVLQILFYLTPVFYSLSLVKDSFPRSLFFIYILNPFVCILSLYRIILLKGYYQAIKTDTNWAILLVMPALLAFALLLLAGFLYRKNESRINDYLSY